MRRGLWTVGIGLCLLGGQASAAPQGDLALGRRVAASSLFQGLMEQAVRGDILRAHPGLNNQQQAALSAAAVRATAAVRPVIVERVAHVYADTFSSAELATMATFFESAAGKAYVARFPKVAASMGAVLSDPALKAQVEARVCAETKLCPVAPAVQR